MHSLWPAIPSEIREEDPYCLVSGFDRDAVLLYHVCSFRMATCLYTPALSRLLCHKEACRLSMDMRSAQLGWSTHGFWLALLFRAREDNFRSRMPDFDRGAILP